MSSFTWENGSLRLALAIDSSIYFVTLRPNYKRAYMGIMGGNLASGSLVYGYQRFTRGEDVNGIMFWNPRSGEMNRKYARVRLCVCFMFNILSLGTFQS
jgi:WD repeat-containing protein 35